MAAEVGGEVFHPPDGSLHLEQEGQIVLFRSRDPAAGIPEHMVFTLWICLCDNGFHASWFGGITQAGICDEAEGMVFAGMPHYGGRAEAG